MACFYDMPPLFEKKRSPFCVEMEREAATSSLFQNGFIAPVPFLFEN